MALVHVHVPLIDMAQYCMPAYFQQYFITVSESNEYEKMQIMQSLNEPNTGKTQILEHGHLYKEIEL